MQLDPRPTKILSLLIIAMLVLMPLTNQSLFTSAIKKGRNTLSSNVEKYRTFDTSQVKLNFYELRSYIKNNLIKYGGITRPNGDDPLMNHTYFGILVMYILGSLKDTLLDDFTNKFLKYTYDEDNYAFRPWFGANASIKATLWGLLLINATGILPKDFSLAGTLQFIKNELETEGLSQLDLLESSLLAIIANIYNKSLLLPSEITISALLDHILTYYSEGLFKDDNYPDSIFTTFFALKAVLYHEPSLILDKTDEIISKILSLRNNNENSSLNGGFGANPTTPTVFDTGLAIDILIRLREYTTDPILNATLYNESFWSASIEFINASQKNGGIASNPIIANSSSAFSTMDALNAFGAILAYAALGKLQKLYQISTIVSPSEQIAVDDPAPRLINATITILSDRIYNFSAYAKIKNVITNDTYSLKMTQIFNDVPYYSANITNLNLSYGNYKAILTFKKQLGLNDIIINKTLTFRVGYLITLRVDPTKDFYLPGSNITLNLELKFHNSTLVNNTHVYVKMLFKYTKDIFFQTDATINGTFTVNISLVNNIRLGQYSIIAYVNDSWGFNHTFASYNIGIKDNITFSVVGNSSEYYLSQTFNFGINNISYVSTGDIYLPVNATLKIVTNSEKFYSLPIQITSRNISINGTIPTVLPKSLNISFILELSWDNTSFGNISVPLFNASIKIGALTISRLLIETTDGISPINDTNILLGKNYTILLQINHTYNNTNAILANATVSSAIEYNPFSFSENELNYTNDGYYKGWLYIDPNIPPTWVNYTAKIYLPFNNSYKSLTSMFLVRGTIEIVNWTETKLVYQNSEYYANFKIICSETGEGLAGINLYANITLIGDTNKSMLIPTAYINSTYVLSFYVGTYKKAVIDLLRTTDNATIYHKTLDIHSPPFELPKINPSTLFTLVAIGAYIAYVIAHKRYTSKVSRRFLIERSKKL